jgi:hypothetical protein
VPVQIMCCYMSNRPDAGIVTRIFD